MVVLHAKDEGRTLVYQMIYADLRDVQRRLEDWVAGALKESVEYIGLCSNTMLVGASIGKDVGRPHESTVPCRENVCHGVGINTSIMTPRASAHYHRQICRSVLPRPNRSNYWKRSLGSLIGKWLVGDWNVGLLHSISHRNQGEHTSHYASVICFS